MTSLDFSSESTVEGELGAWEVAKAFAFHVVIQNLAVAWDTSASELVGGGRVDAYIAKQLVLKGGGNPSERCIRDVIKRCQEPGWYPGKGTKGCGGGRPPVYTEHQKSEVARVAMELKRSLVAPTPRRVRARLPNASCNPETGEPMSRNTINKIFQTLCYDEKEDDPWQYLHCLSQDVLPAELKPRRVAAGKHILDTTTATSWRSHVAFDPCYCLLARTQEMLEEQKIAAMGKMRWMSKKSRRQGSNLRAPSTVKTQSNNYKALRVDWTPIFARGKLTIYVVDADAAKADPSLPAKLTDATNLSKFVRNVLPRVMQKMKTKHRWNDIPRTVVHDPASYMVYSRQGQLVERFASALEEAGFRSWVGGPTDDASWLVKKFGDIYLHETVVAHIRKLLDGKFCYNRLDETPAHFRQRMQQVEDYMNSPSFSACGGDGLLGLAKELRPRCEAMIKLKGERLPK